MAFINIEDLYGTMEVIAFENAYQSAGTSLIEDNIVYIEGRVSIKEDEQTITIIANKIQDFNTVNDRQQNEKANLNNSSLHKIKVLNIDITSLSEGQKDRLRGALKFFTGDRNNTQVYIIKDGKKMPAGGVFLNGDTLKEIEEIVGNENIIMQS